MTRKQADTGNLLARPAVLVLGLFPKQPSNETLETRS